MTALEKFAEFGTPLGLVIPENMSLDGWVKMGKTLARASERLNWWVGDWWAFGVHEWGDDAIKALPAEYALKTVENMGSVSRAFAHADRRDDLTWSHHMHVVGLEPQERVVFLERAAREGLSTRGLRTVVEEYRRSLVEPDPVPSAGNGDSPLPATTPPDSAESSEPPTIPVRLPEPSQPPAEPDPPTIPPVGRELDELTLREQHQAKSKLVESVAAQLHRIVESDPVAVAHAVAPDRRAGLGKRLYQWASAVEAELRGTTKNGILPGASRPVGQTAVVGELPDTCLHPRSSETKDVIQGVVIVRCGLCQVRLR